MKRNLIGIAAAALLCVMIVSLQAQTPTYTISGTVTWKGGGHNGEPVVGASVRIAPGNYTATTDAMGRYTVTGVGSGPHTIHIKSKDPNGSVTKGVTVNQNKVVDIKVRYRHVSIRKRNGGVGLGKQ
jgi:Carboxypeptidase regulatory-like domain